MASGITLTCALLITAVMTSEASFGGHEHVHIRVHVPHLINEVHHQKKIIHVEHAHHDDHDGHYDPHSFDDFGGSDFGGNDFGGYGHHGYP